MIVTPRDSVVRYEKFDVRTGTEADVAAMVEFDREVTGTAKPEYWDRLFRETRRDEPCYVFVAEDEGRLVGIIVGAIRAWEFGSEPCGWVFTISVTAAYREHGVASALFQALSEAFHAAGVRKMRTMVRRDDHVVMSFFRSQGMMAGPFLQLEKELAP